jgi:signal transduction histidine kinase
MRKLVTLSLALGLLLILAGLRWNDIRQSRTETVDAATLRASSLALILSEYVAGAFGAGDAALRQLALHSQRIGGPDAPASEWTPSLHSARAGVNGIGAISIVDRDLVIRHSTRSDIVGQSRRGDPYIATKLMESEDLFVGVPFKSPATGEYLIPIGRRLTASDGTTAGAAVASFLPQDLRQFFQSLKVGDAGNVWIFHSAGTLVVREPSPADPMGTPATDNALFAAASSAPSGAGILHGPVTPDGPRMVSAYRRIDRLPLLVAVALDEAEVLAAWRREVRGFVTTYGLISLLLTGVLFVLSRQIDAKAAAQAELQRARLAEEERLRTTNAQLSALLEREQSARREAESASALKDQFVMTVSHELRTPLTAIAGWARMLVDGMVTEDKREAALRTIERNAEAQRRLIEDLLDMAGVMAGKLRLDVRTIAIAEVIYNAVEAVMPAANAKGIRLDTDVSAHIGTMSADPERLQQIVWNLLSNAVKFTPHGGRVSLTVARCDEQLRITVTDTGAGIAPELLPHVFDRFRQGSAGTSRRQGGLGLGLAIVRNLVELHGGTVIAHSEGEGRGARFDVHLPVPSVSREPVVQPSHETAIGNT